LLPLAIEMLESLWLLFDQSDKLTGRTAEEFRRWLKLQIVSFQQIQSLGQQSRIIFVLATDFDPSLLTTTPPELAWPL
jgi:hypothetical protein